MAFKKESFFWTSYSDLMTSLFFIMLVLFVLVIVLLHTRMVTTEAELNEIKKVEESTKDLDSTYFEYRPEYKKYVLKAYCFFKQLRYDINELPDTTRYRLDNAGKEIHNFLVRHHENQYILIIEGQASRNSYKWTDKNYHLSFARAYSLMKYWKDNCHIDFGNNCEIQIAGSGDGRYNVEPMRDVTKWKNQRFLIHIIPKNIIENSN